MPKKVKHNKIKSSLVAISGGRTFKDQPLFTCIVPQEEMTFNTTVTSGVINGAYSVSPQAGANPVIQWAARFGTFQEYRVIAADFEVRCLAPSTGVTLFFLDEKSVSVVAIAGFREISTKAVVNNSAAPQASFMMRWKAKDLADLAFTAIGSNIVPVTLKLYTDTTDFGAPAVATALWYVRATLKIQFRGFEVV